MKVVIIEGTDNVGKDTVINKIKEQFDSSKVFHCEKPKTIDPISQGIEQEKTFADLMGETTYGYSLLSSPNTVGKWVLIHNRSWYGEYVYGCMYRQNDPDRVKEIIKHLEIVITSFIPEDDICFITLLSNNIDFLVKNDDGLSISEAKKELIEEETHRFEEIFKYSNIKNKHIIYVNDGDKFRPEDDIFNEVMKYINNEDISN